jgi:hypothetical protein
LDKHQTVYNTYGRNERIFAQIYISVSVILWLSINFVVCKYRLLYEVSCSSNNKDYVSQFNSSVLPFVASSNVEKY